MVATLRSEAILGYADTRGGEGASTGTIRKDLAALSVMFGWAIARGVRWNFETGQDRGEILALSWGDIDMKAGTVVAPRQKTGEERTIFLNAVTREILLEARMVLTGFVRSQ
jgi:integrase